LADWSAGGDRTGGSIHDRVHGGRCAGEIAKDTTITEATPVAATTRCRPTAGWTPTSVPGNDVNFRLGLPASWNGKFYFTGVGGLGGASGR
jgi:hypothetical protein